jgi:hypothetical protein
VGGFCLLLLLNWVLLIVIQALIGGGTFGTFWSFL